MKRLHVNLAVSDLTRSTAFYAHLFGRDPDVTKPDYAKWMLEDPRVNFAIAVRDRPAGVDHLGIQVEEAGELEEIAERLRAAGETVVDQDKAVCCYALSDKAWSRDPDGVSWETFHTLDSVTTYGSDAVPEAVHPAHEGAGEEGAAAGDCCPEAGCGEHALPAPKETGKTPASATGGACCA